MKADRNDRMARCARALCAGIALASVPVGFFVACGGSTGKEGLPQPPGVAADSGGDATISTIAEASPDVASTEEPRPVTEAGSDDSSSDETSFDAGIEYADAARLPDVVRAPNTDSGVTMANPWDTWPACNRDTPVTSNPAMACQTAYSEIADDSGACPIYRWMTTYTDSGPSCEQCLRDNACGTCDRGVFPPCSDLREAGTAAQGPGAGKPLYDLCAALFECVLQSSCILSGTPARADNCYCGTAQGAACTQPGAANGVCKAEIEAAGQISKSTPVSDILSHITDVLSNAPSHTSAEVLALFNCSFVGNCTMCFPARKADGGH